MAIQTVYNDELVAGVAGEIANSIPATLISRTVETEAGAALGVPMAQGTADLGAVIFAGNAAAGFVGITVRERSLDPNTPNLFAQYETARLMTKGAVYVQASEAVDAGDAVYINDTTGVFSKTATGATLIAGARWDTSTTDAGLAIVRLA